MTLYHEDLIPLDLDEQWDYVQLQACEKCLTRRIYTSQELCSKCNHCSHFWCYLQGQRSSSKQIRSAHTQPGYDQVC